MKILKYLSVVAVLAIALTSCFKNVNDTMFSDKDAFIAFDNPNGARLTSSVLESAGTVEVTVRLSSVSGLEGSVEVVIIDSLSTAIAGSDYTDPGVSTLSFDADNKTATFSMQLIDNDDEATNNRTIVVGLTNADGVQIGADNQYVITLVNDDFDVNDPMAALYGTYTCTETDIDGVVQTYSVDIEAVEGSPTGVLVTNIWNAGETIVGEVNLTAMTISFVPMQVVAMNGDTELIYMYGYYDDEYYIDQTATLVWTIDELSSTLVSITGSDYMPVDLVGGGLYDYCTEVTYVKSL